MSVANNVLLHNGAARVSLVNSAMDRSSIILYCNCDRLLCVSLTSIAGGSLQLAGRQFGFAGASALLLLLLCALLGRPPKLVRLLPLTFLVALSLGVSLSIAPDGYQQMGRSPRPRTPALFDWLVKREVDAAPFESRWLRDAIGMSLLGLTYTLPSGSLLLLFGFGWFVDNTLRLHLFFFFFFF